MAGEHIKMAPFYVLLFYVCASFVSLSHYVYMPPGWHVSHFILPIIPNPREGLISKAGSWEEKNPTHVLSAHRNGHRHIDVLIIRADNLWRMATGAGWTFRLPIWRKESKHGCDSDLCTQDAIFSFMSYAQTISPHVNDLDLFVKKINPCA